MRNKTDLNHSIRRHLLQRVLLVLVLVISVVALNGNAGIVRADTPMPSHGLVCTTDPTSTFTLTTQTGYINMPDGNVAYMWGFSVGNQPFQHPSPVLCVNEGDTVTVVVHNTLPEPISIIFPGQEGVLADGLPSQPEYDDVSGEMVSLTRTAPKDGSVTYSFVASKPGTFLYESGTNPIMQVNMGLFGALIVRPAMGANYAYNHAESIFTEGEEFLMLLSEIDPYLHTAVEHGHDFNVNDYQARYWLINGRGFPDTIAPNGASWLPNQPFGSLAHIYPKTAGHPDPMLVRYLSVGSENYPFHPHGNHGRVIARDGNPLLAAEDISYEKFTVVVSPGQSIDATFYWENVDGYDPVTNPIPVTIPQLQNLVYGQFFSGSPYLGNVQDLPVGTQALNQCGEYYHIAHNHALHQITAWGVVLSGHITFTRIDPPLVNGVPGSNGCP